MLRKLTSLLFKEEEIIIEEEELEIEPVKIPTVQPMQTTQSTQKNRVESQTQTMQQNRTEMQSNTIRNTEDSVRDVKPSVEQTQATPTQTKKSFRIDLDGSSTAQPQRPVQETQRDMRKESDKPYIAHEILSPIHGGSQLQNEPLSKAKVQNVKKRTPLTEVISPMYGKIEEPPTQNGEALDLSILELDVETMITPDYQKTSDSEEVQTTLFDYLEGDESSES